MKFSPVGNKIIVKPDVEVEVKTSAGLFIPSSVETKTIYGTIMAVGSGYYTKDGILIPLEVSVGERVLINKTAGNEIRADKEVYRTITQDDIIAIVTE